MAQPATSRKKKEVAGHVWGRTMARGRMGEGSKNDPLKAQLHAASGRNSKIIRDREAIEAVVEVPGAGELVLRVDNAGGYSLRGRPAGKESGEATGRDLIVVGVVRANEVVVVRPGEPSAEHES